MSIQLGKPSPRQLLGTLVPIDNPLNKSASACNPEKKLKYIVGLPSNRPSTFKTSAREEENNSADLITESDDISSPSRYQKSVRLAKPRNKNFHSMEYNAIKKANDTIDIDDSEDYRKGLITPIKTERLISEDEDPHDILGKEAVNNFYMHYKKLDKIKDINIFTQVSDATYTSFLDKSETLNLLPSKIGFIREKGEANKIKLNHYRLGDKYAEVLSEGLKSVRSFNKIELANNRLTPTGANYLLPKLTHQTEFIDLAGNNIGKIGCDHLSSIINMKNSRLLELNLEGNKLGDSAVNQLCEAIAYNNSLRKLNIGKNLLSDNSAEKISKMLELSSTLEELYLQWNQIKSFGGMTIVNGLALASKLKILDFSWNSLGLNGSHFAKSFSTYIGANTTLAHLDLSNNYLNKQDSKIIAEELKSNHTLYGLHFHGNSGYVDCKGFLIIPDDWDTAIAGRVTQPPIDGAKFQAESLKHHVGNWGEYKDVCWICEGWRPVELAWTPGESGIQDRDPIYIHISYEGYKGVFLPSKNNFKTIRMAPPNKFEYFFSADDVQTYAEGQNCGKPENPSIKIDIGGEEKNVKLDFVNIISKSHPGQILDRDYDVVYELRDLDMKPRILDEVYIPLEIALERPQWKFPISIFRNFKSDTQALLDECFKVDFEGTRISKLVKNLDDLEQIRQVLYEVYRPLRDCYKYYATIGAPSDIWSIPLNTYTEFCNSCGIIDGKILKLSDFDRIFIATYTRTEKDKNPRNPDRALVRYQFLEGLVRISEQKYLSTGIMSTYADAMKMLMNESVIPYISKFNHHQWRPERYWNEEVDTVYKSYLPIVRGIYKKYSGQKTLPGQKKFMCLEEFNRLVSEANMFTDSCGERDATLAFNLAMMNQVDELNSDRIYQMQFIEFLEALARITEKFSPLPYGFDAQNIQNGMPDVIMSFEQRSSQPLCIKLEGLMPILFSLCGNDVKEIWTLPETSIFQMEEVHGKQRFPTKKKKIFRINPTHHSSIEPYEGINALQI